MRAKPRSGVEAAFVFIDAYVCVIVDYSSSGIENGLNWEMGRDLQ